MDILTARASHYAAVMALNEADVAHLSALDHGGLERLAKLACYFRVAEIDGRVVGFLLALPAKAPYASENFRWFDARYPDFVYIDRVVVAADIRRAGVASALYDDLDAQTRASKVSIIACEINVRPPNPDSVSFHEQRGFVEVGTQEIAMGSKTVSLRIKRLC